MACHRTAAGYERGCTSVQSLRGPEKGNKGCEAYQTLALRCFFFRMLLMIMPTETTAPT